MSIFESILNMILLIFEVMASSLANIQSVFSIKEKLKKRKTLRAKGARSAAENTSNLRQERGSRLFPSFILA